MINGKVLIVDVSFWQDDDTTPKKIDFVQMKNAGADGVILRAGQNTWPDEDFQDYLRDARLAGLPVGYYWFWDSRSSPGLEAGGQARRFSDIIKQNGFPELGIWADYEEYFNGQYSGIANFRKFVDSLVKEFPGKLIGIYTGYYYWLENTGNLDRNWGKNFPLWIARYNVDSPTVPANWTSYLIWQFTSKGDGTIFGVESLNIDLNYFNGSYEDYIRTFGLDGQVPPVGGTMEKYEAIGQYGLNFRTGPSTSNSVIMLSAKGSIIWGVKEAATGWIKGSYYQQPGEQYATKMDFYCSGTTYYVKQLAYTEPVTPPVIPVPAKETIIKLSYDDADNVTAIQVDGIEWRKL